MAVIGIDLGTTNSLAVTYREGQVVLIPNEFGEFLTPSVVHVDKDRLTVGKLAKERLVTDSLNTAQLFKRSMGTEDTFRLGKKHYSALDLSAMVVKQLIADAERFLNEKVEEVLISVPAYFNDRQRSATKAIGDLLGIKVERIINEPSAAAIACHQLGTDETFVVFDFGGGTLDVSVVDCFENVVSITAIAGDNFLGGSDFDLALAKDFCQKQNLDFDHLEKDAQSSLLLAAERCKLKLQDQAQASIALVVEDEMRMTTYKEGQLRDIIQPVLTRVKKVIAKAVKESGYEAQDLKTLVLVGGSSQMPLVQAYLQEILNLPLKTGPEMDELVARGLGTYLAIKTREEAVKHLVVTDICPFSLGVDTYNEELAQLIFDKIITKNTVLPTSASTVYSTLKLGQSRIKFSVYQGESLNTAANLHLGSVTIPVPINHKYHERVKVTFSYDINSLLYVEILVLSTQEHYIYQVGKDQKMARLSSSQHLADIQKLSSQINSEPLYTALMERAERLAAELPHDMQLQFQKNIYQLQADYQTATNHIKKRQQVLQLLKSYLDKLETYVDGDHLDIFKRDE